MKIVSRIVAVLLFILFFGFALKNTHEVDLHLFFKYELHAPLVLMVLGFFVLGASMGVLAMSPYVFTHKREIARLQKQIHTMQQEKQELQQVREQPPQPDSVVALST
ncbi:MAG: LapA family protein [Burkholderiales bacterium]|nr:LapA family protein [Burkholderiales bacterium]